jgi:hypothetical protein
VKIEVSRTISNDYDWKAVVYRGGAFQYFYGNTAVEALLKLVLSLMEKKP